jgi:uncharacterized lipoprotein YehR (DUF1307 family)
MKIKLISMQHNNGKIIALNKLYSNESLEYLMPRLKSYNTFQTITALFNEFKEVLDQGKIPNNFIDVISHIDPQFDTESFNLASHKVSYLKKYLKNLISKNLLVKFEISNFIEKLNINIRSVEFNDKFSRTIESLVTPEGDGYKVLEPTLSFDLKYDEITKDNKQEISKHLEEVIEAIVVGKDFVISNTDNRVHSHPNIDMNELDFSDPVAVAERIKLSVEDISNAKFNNETGNYEIVVLVPSNDIVYEVKFLAEDIPLSILFPNGKAKRTQDIKLFKMSENEINKMSFAKLVSYAASKLPNKYLSINEWHDNNKELEDLVYMMRSDEDLDEYDRLYLSELVDEKLDKQSEYKKLIKNLLKEYGFIDDPNRFKPITLTRESVIPKNLDEWDKIRKESKDRNIDIVYNFNCTDPRGKGKVVFEPDFFRYLKKLEPCCFDPLHTLLNRIDLYIVKQGNSDDSHIRPTRKGASNGKHSWRIYGQFDNGILFAKKYSKHL